jgi:pilus assembly protein Flp/PilA
MLRLLQRLFSDEAGQGLAEYALIIALIALVVIGVLTALGTQIKAIFSAIKEKLVVPTD